MKDILISPPFGNYIRSSKATPILGSYTLSPRSGRLMKVGQFVLDNLRHPVPGGWRNRIGLRNPGIASLDRLEDDRVYSIVGGLEPVDWEANLYVLLEKPWGRRRPHVELNVSCPNVHGSLISRATLERYTRVFVVTVKLWPDLETILPFVDICGQAGVDYLHCSNTVPSDLGGLSGYPLKAINLPIVERLAQEWTVIGGGGIYGWQDLLDYSSAGASYFSISTLWFHPIRAMKLINRYYEI